MKFENTEVWGFEHALRGMRNPKESWDKSDSCKCCLEISDDCNMVLNRNTPVKCHDGAFNFCIGENDLRLAQQLIKAGSEHRKFIRQIFVSVDITAPLYWWKEFDTYKVATVANSTSTMHKLATTPITIDCFETDDLFNTEKLIGIDIHIANIIGSMYQQVIDTLEETRQLYLRTKDKMYWKELIRWLPESWLQKRTVTINYENLLGMCSKGQRRFHKLNEWSGIDKPDVPNFISWARSLPYAKELIFLDESEN